MTQLSFSLSPGALIRLHDALICLSKFNESVALEAEYDLVNLLSRSRHGTIYQLMDSSFD